MRNVFLLEPYAECVFLTFCIVNQAVLETVARVKQKKNETKEEKYILLSLNQTILKGSSFYALSPKSFCDESSIKYL